MAAKFARYSHTTRTKKNIRNIENNQSKVENVCGLTIFINRFDYFFCRRRCGCAIPCRSSWKTSGSGIGGGGVVDDVEAVTSREHNNTTNTALTKVIMQIMVTKHTCTCNYNGTSATRRSPVRRSRTHRGPQVACLSSSSSSSATCSFTSFQLVLHWSNCETLPLTSRNSQSD